MITNERQYQQTCRKLVDLEAMIASTEAGEAGEAGDEGFLDVQLSALRSQAEDLREEIEVPPV